MVSRPVACDAELVKEVRGFTRKNAFEFQASQQIGLRFFRRSKKSCACRSRLSEQFSELPKLDEAGIGIVLKIVFRQCPEAHQLRAISFEKAKIS